MKKIPTLFQRDPENMKHVLPEVNPECEWVLRGEGVATRKYDGTCCMAQGGKLFKRHELKPGKAAPEGFVPAQDPDPKTGKQPGWVPVWIDDPASKHHLEAFKAAPCPLPDGTYELIGPKVQGNPEGVSAHVLVPHGSERSPRYDNPREHADFATDFTVHMDALGWEGIVWHHPDGRMAKLKRRDFA